MKIGLVILFGLLTITTLGFQLVGDQLTSKIELIQSQGNITAEMKQYIKSLINNSTQLYRRYMLVDMAKYIGQNLNRNYGETWQVFVYGVDTQDCNFNASTVFGNKWLKWEQYGLYDLCYVIYNTHSCYAPKVIKSQEQNWQEDWGYSWSDQQKDRIKALIDQATTYGGNSMALNAQYINARLGPGGWAVSIAGPSNGVGAFTCYYKGYYAYLVDFTDFLWTYVIIKQF